MNLETIKSILSANHKREWQLYLAIGINRSTFNSWSHTNFKGHEATVQKGLNKLLKKGKAKND